MIYIMVMPRGHKQEEGFIILGAIQFARKTYFLALQVYNLIYEKEHWADEGEKFLRSCDLICLSGFPCSLAMMVMTLFWNVWAICSCVVKHNMRAWRGEHHSLQKTHLTRHSLNCLLAGNWREMLDNSAEKASPNHLNFVVAPYEGFIAISQSTSMFGLTCGSLPSGSQWH